VYVYVYVVRVQYGLASKVKLSVCQSPHFVTTLLAST
jgi:hypothetical protein